MADWLIDRINLFIESLIDLEVPFEKLHSIHLFVTWRFFAKD